MTIARFRVQNHPQQIGTRGARPEIDDRATSPELFNELNLRFGFTLDVAASAANTKCEQYFSSEDDGLTQSWQGRVWCNPPYSNIPAWVDKAWCEWDSEHAELIVMLLPANRTEQSWWHLLVEPYRDRDNGFRVEFLPGRHRFVSEDSFVDMFGKPRGRNERPPFGCCLLIWST